MRLSVIILTIGFLLCVDLTAQDTISPERTPMKDIVLNHDDNSIVFKLDENQGFLFSFFLEGFDKKPTPWTHTGLKEYTNLPGGKYIFHTTVRDSINRIRELENLNIHVLRPWYLTSSAITVYILFIALLAWAIFEQMNLNFAKRQYVLEQIINKRTEDLIIEKEKSEALLANVLPRDTASEIMSKGKATKIKYNFVTVLFSDIQGFTKIAEELNPEVLIDELDKFFFHFDSVVEKFRIEKIKTIGDAYMCAGGIPEKNRTNPVEIILAALEMKSYMKRLRESSELEGMKYWDIRIGIHTGTVVAGVVGQKKLSYDIWGDTVNTASRMESSGEAGKINISGTTYEFVKDFFTCEYRGKMPVKYKGELEMYFVNGIVPELSDEKGEPNSKFVTKMQMIKLLDIEEAVLRLFEEEASPNLYFHNAALVKSVVNHAELLSGSEKLPDEDFIILKLAAIFLFTGYIYDYDKPLDESINLVNAILPKYGLNQEYATRVTALIRNSYNKMIVSLSDKILHDARYDYMGRVDYLKLTDKLLRELTEYGKHPESKAWIEYQKKLLKEHDFLTKTARLLRDVQVEEQLLALGKK